MSYSEEQTEKKLKKLERELSKLYKEAYKEMDEKASLYFAKYEERWEQEYQAFQDGVYTEAEFKNWEMAQLGRGERWNVLRDEMANRMTRTNEIASAYINDKTPSIYSLNANYTAYQIAKDTGTLSASWVMIDEQDLRDQMVNNINSIEFKTTSVNPVRDYEWNTKQIQRALNAGILQGKAIKELTNSFLTVMQRNRTSAIRNARTSVTSAQNSGTINAMKQSKEKGIDVKKKWVATYDARTRFSHALLNGQIRDVDDEFSNGLMHPADSDGAPEEVYNCRCTMTYIHPKYDKVASNERWDSMTPEERKEEAKRYKEWVKSQEGIHKSKQTDFEWDKNDIGAINTLNNNSANSANNAQASDIVKKLMGSNIASNQVKALTTQLSESDIIDRVGGGDMTKGSCASLGFAYVGNKSGFDVLDFRGGESCNFFSKTGHIIDIGNLSGVKSTVIEDYNDIKATVSLLKTMENDKEYLLATGKHLAVVKKAQSEYVYLELQSATDNGFKKLTTTELKKRFGCQKSHSIAGMKLKAKSVLIEADSLYNSNEFKDVLSYINTSKADQQKGAKGHVK